MKLNQMRAIAATFKPIKSFAAGALALALVLLAAGNAFAVAYNWTNTTGAVLNDPNAWSPVGGPGGAVDTATISVNGTVHIPLTNDCLNNTGFWFIGATAGGQTLNLSLDLSTNTLTGTSAVSYTHLT